MKKLLFAAVLCLALFSCKDEKLPDTLAQNIGNEKYSHHYGLWSGDIDPDYTTHEAVDDMTKKITIKISRITGGIVEGQSIVSGNIRPLTGTLHDDGYGKIALVLNEPGTDDHDGYYELELVNGVMKGSFYSYKKNADAFSRKLLTLVQKQFTYNPNLMLDEEVDLVDWFTPREEMMEHHAEDYEDMEEEGQVENDGETPVTKTEPAPETAVAATDTTQPSGEEIQSYLTEVYRSASEAVFKINASTTKLNEEELKELHKLDLEIIRNTIFARHGFSFKKNSIRRFFEVNSWYVPVSNNVDKQLTKLEKENIALLVRLEKYAEDHYDYFGR